MSAHPLTPLRTLRHTAEGSAIVLFLLTAACTDHGTVAAPAQATGMVAKAAV